MEVSEPAALALLQDSRTALRPHQDSLTKGFLSSLLLQQDSRTALTLQQDSLTVGSLSSLLLRLLLHQTAHALMTMASVSVVEIFEMS